jgi:hypothetical protein
MQQWLPQNENMIGMHFYEEVLWVSLSIKLFYYLKECIINIIILCYTLNNSNNFDLFLKKIQAYFSNLLFFTTLDCLLYINCVILKSIC